MKSKPKGPFLGINNRLPDFALHINTRQVQGDHLRDAVNVDIDNAGLIVRRQATANLVALTNPHSLHMADSTNGYMVIGGMMYRVTLPSYTQTLFLALTNNDPVAWLAVGDSLYYSNGVDSGRIANGVNYPWGLPTPEEPATSQIGGDLFKGGHQVAVAYRNNVTGEMGGVSPSSNPSVTTTTGGLRVMLPGAVPGATHIDIYISTVNGSIPMLVATVVVGTTLYDITSYGSGREANQRYESPLPAGSQLFYFNGCLCSIKGNDVFEGIPFRPGYYLPAEGRIPFPTEVSNVVPAQNGVYVVSDKTYWIPGTRITSATDAIQDVLPYGGTKGTSFITPSKTQVGWFGADGIVLADIKGEVEAVMFDNIDLVAPASGISILSDKGGYLRVVSCGWCLNLENLAVTRYEGFDFTSASNGYATGSDGVYALDVTGKVTATVNLGKENFGVENLKHLPAVYLGVDAVNPMRLRVQTPEHDFTYSARSADDVTRIQRIDPGKGLRASWYNLTVSNDGGSDFTLASVSFAPVASTRRI